MAAIIEINIDKAKRDLQRLEQTIRELNYSGDDNEKVVKDLEKQYDALAANIAKAETGGKSLGRELKDLTLKLQQMKLEGRENTKAYQDMLTRAGQLRDAMADTAAAINKTASDTANLDAILGGASAVSGGFGLAISTMSLLGKDTEDVEKAQKKLQQAIALVNSVQAIANALNKDSALMIKANAIATKLLGTQMKATATATTGASTAMKGFKAAMVSTGVGALVVGLGFIASKMLDIADNTKSTKKEVDTLNNAKLDKLRNEIESAERASENFRNRIVDINFELDNFGATDIEKLTAKIEKNNLKIADARFEMEQLVNLGRRMNAEERERFTLLGRQIEEYEEANVLLNKQIELRNKEIEADKKEQERQEAIKKAKEYLEIVKGINDALQMNKKSLRELEAELLKGDVFAYYAKASENAMLTKTEDIEAENKRYEEQIKTLKKNSDEAEKAKELHNTNLLKIDYEYRIRVKSLDEDLANYLAEKRKEQDEKNEEMIKKYEEDLANARLINADKTINARLALDLALLDERYKAEIKNANDIGRDTTEIYQAWEEEKNKLQITAMNERMDLFNSMVGNLSTIMDASFEDNKGIQIATTVATTVANAAQAFGSTFAQTKGEVYVKAAAAALASGAVIANGAMAIKNIKKTTKNSTSIDGAKSTTSTGARNDAVDSTLISRRYESLREERMTTVVVVDEITAKQQQIANSNKVRTI